MTVEEAVRDRLADDAAIAAVVSARVYQLILPESPTYPAIRVQLIAEPGMSHLRGADALTRARVQTDAYVDATTGDDPYATAATLNAAIQAALVDDGPFSAGTPPARRVTGVLPFPRQVLYEAEERRLVRVMQDFIVWSHPLS